jgi:HK97 family phage portal protein
MIGPVLGARADPELRATYRDPDGWLYDFLADGADNVSGISMSPRKALGIAAYWASIQAISQDTAKLPLKLYERMPNGEKRLRDNHPLYPILHDAPNDEMSTMVFRETLMHHVLGWGNGYAEIVRDGTGGALELWPLDPTLVRVERDKDRGQLVYWVRYDYRSPEKPLAPGRVFHLQGLGFNGITGYSVAQMAKQTLGLALASERSGASFFGAGSRPGGILEHPKVLDEEARKNLRKSWEAMHKGSENAHKTAVLEQGLTFKPMGIPNEDAQWLESRQFSVEEIARFFRIPPHKIGHLADATYSNIESQAISYVSDTLLAWLVRWEQEIQRKLIGKREQRLFAEHSVNGLLRGDTKARFTAYQMAILSGWMSRNEARELENMNPVEDLDTFLEPLNMGPAGGTKEPEPEPADELNSFVRSYSPLMMDVIQRVLGIEADKLARAAKRGADGNGWVDAFYASHVDYAHKAFRPVVDNLGATLWGLNHSGEMPSAVSGVLGTYAKEMAARHVVESQQQIRVSGPAAVGSLMESRARQAAEMEVRGIIDTMRRLSDGND